MAAAGFDTLGFQVAVPYFLHVAGDIHDVTTLAAVEVTPIRQFEILARVELFIGVVVIGNAQHVLVIGVEAQPLERFVEQGG